MISKALMNSFSWQTVEKELFLPQFYWADMHFALEGMGL